MNSIFKSALFNSVATALYVILVGSFMYYSGEHKLGQSQTVLIPIFILMLLVFSAALTGSLMVGKPVLWYLEGKKKEAIALLAYTLGIFFLITLVAMVLLFIFAK